MHCKRLSRTRMGCRLAQDASAVHGPQTKENYNRPESLFCFCPVFSFFWPSRPVAEFAGLQCNDIRIRPV